MLRTAPSKAGASRFRVLEHLAPTPFFARSVAVDRELARRVTLYFVRDEAFELEGDVAARISVEARRARRLVHPHIVRTRSAGSHGQIPFATEEIIDAPRLHDAVGKPRALRRDRQFQAAIHICEGVAYAHGFGLVHGGLEAGLLYVTEAGEAWVGGFGTVGALARAGAAPQAVVSQRGIYAAPEERRGVGPSMRTDVFALGVAACEILGSGPLQPEGMSTAAIEQRLVEISRQEDVPPALVGAVRRAVSSRPEERQRSAVELLAEMRDAVPAPQAAWLGGTEAASEAPRAVPRAGADLSWPQFAAGLLTTNVIGLLKVAVTLLLIFCAVGGAFLYSVSQSPPDVPVPDVVGQPVEKANGILSDRGLRPVRGESRYSSKHHAGVVVRTRPYAKKWVKEGREVELIVSLGERRYPVPDVVKLSLDDAKSRITRAGFKLGETNEEHSHTVKKGLVIRQSPVARSRSGRSAAVDLVVSKGRPPRERGSESGDEVGYTLVTVRVPEGSPYQRLRALVLEEDAPPRTAYDRMHRPGEEVEIRVSGRGEHKVRIYLDHKVIRETTCDW